MAWRITTVVLCIASWTLAVWLATHEEPGGSVLGRYSPGYAGLLLVTLCVAGFLTLVQLRKPLYDALVRVRAKLIALCVSLIVVVALLEGVLQALDPLGLSTYEETRKYLVWMEPAGDGLIYRHPANARAEFQGVAVATNELGMRDAAIEPRQPRERRILVLGDSVTFGWGVAAEDTFCAQLGPLLAEGGKAPVRVLNSGVGGWNTDQELAFLRKHGDDLRPDAVLLVYVHNDVSLQGAFDPWSGDSFEGKRPPEVLHMLVRGSQLYNLVRHVRGQAADAEDGPTPEAAGWQSSMAAVDQVCRWCKKRDIPAGVVLYRRVASPKYAGLRADLSPITRAHGAAFIDTGDWFAGHPPAEVCNSAADVHPNAAGHTIVARGLAAAIRREQLLAP